MCFSLYLSILSHIKMLNFKTVLEGDKSVNVLFVVEKDSKY